MRRILLLSALAITVVTQYYKPVSAPASSSRHLCPITVTDREECQRACDCARGDSTNCSSFKPPIPSSYCQAYFYQNGGCALLGEAGVGNTCTRNKTEYVLGPDDPCANLTCIHGECLVSEDLTAHCECDVGYSGTKCDTKAGNYRNMFTGNLSLEDAGYHANCSVACSANPSQICGRGNYGWLYA